jgi:hypothetical protein
LYTAGELYIAGDVWQWASCVAVGKLGVFGRSLASDPVLAQVSQWPTAGPVDEVGCDAHAGHDGR